MSGKKNKTIFKPHNKKNGFKTDLKQISIFTKTVQSEEKVHMAIFGKLIRTVTIFVLNTK